MKRFALALIMVAAGSLALCAATPKNPWNWELQGGYNVDSGWLDSGWLAETAIGYSFTDNFRLNFQVTYFEGNIVDTDDSSDLYTFMIAPEYDYNYSEKDQLYLFVGAGVADVSSSDVRVPGRGMVHYPSDDVWAGEAGGGYRHFFTDRVGMSFQLTYTHMDFDDAVDTGDARVGLVVRW